MCEDLVGVPRELIIAWTVTTYVSSNPSGWKTASQPKWVDPRAGTIFPYCREEDGVFSFITVEMVG